MCLDNMESVATEIKASVDNAKEQPIATEKKISPREWITNRLKQNGWIESVAGEDYKIAVDGFEKALSVKRGVIISGDYGCGKTSFIKALRCYGEIINCVLPEQVGWLDYEKNPEYVLGLMSKSVFIDDYGAENPINDFGVRRDLIGDFICRYHLYGKGRLYITTNLRGQEIIDKSGGRVYSRLKDLCIPIRFNGKDKRKWEL